jgi:hypothetical protein
MYAPGDLESNNTLAEVDVKRGITWGSRRERIGKR